MAVNREYKSDVFSMLLEDKANALEVYNALNDSNHSDPEEVEIIPLEKGISLTVRNDATFIIDMYMNFYEHQSTYNPNMALRNFIYYANTIEKRLKKENRDLFGRQLIRIPTPRFVVFYNGIEKRPAVEIMKLSEAFVHPMDIPELELICTVYNINPNCNKELLEKSKTLRGYTIFVELVRKKEKEMDSLGTAIDYAMDECIRQHILEEFFRERKDEVRKMTELDFTWERREELIRMEERAQARIEGIVKMISKGYTREQILELDYSEEEYRQAMKIVEKK